MISRVRLLVGISVLWLPLSMLFDGVSSLLLPAYLTDLAPQQAQATILGIMTFVALMSGMLVQPIAGAVSDRLYPRWGGERSSS